MQLAKKAMQLAKKAMQLAKKAIQLAKKATQLAKKATQLAKKATQLAKKAMRLATGARACIRIRMQTKQKIPDFNARRCKSATTRECGRVGWKVRTPAAGGLNRRGLDTPRMRVIMIRAIFLIFSRGIGRCIAAARLGTRQMRRCALELRGVGVS